MYRTQNGAEKLLAREFLTELGRYWLERYGRINPTPYPLAQYDSSVPGIRKGLKRAYPKLQVDSGPKVALGAFAGGKPQFILELYSSLDLPATLVRRISSDRGRHLAESISKESVAETLPPIDVITLDEDTRKVILWSRFEESVRQLREGVIGDTDFQNENALKALDEMNRLFHRDSSSERGLDKKIRLAFSEFRAQPFEFKDKFSLELVQERVLVLGEALLK